MNEQERELSRRLGADPDRDPLRPVWPAVHARLRPARRPAGLRFVLATGLAACVGLWVGVSVPAGDDSTEAVSAASTGSLWTELGASWLTEGQGALGDVYVAETGGTS